MSNQRRNYWPFHRGSRLPLLLQIRWLGQVSDGIFQSALASFVLFSPTRQPNAVAAASAFAVVLLPYSLIGPYAGIFLDRFSRKRIVQISNFIRAGNLILIALIIKNGVTGLLLTALVLISFGLSRLILAGLSAGLPLVIHREELVAANALAVTGGTIGVVIGGGIGIGLKKVFDHSQTSDRAAALIILLAAGGYLSAALRTSFMKRLEIGPAAHEISNEIRGFQEMQEGFQILKSHGDSLRGIFATALQRGGLTALTLCGLLLERNTYHAPSNPDAGLAGFGFALAIAGIGIGLGSLVTPIFVDRIGRHMWIRISMSASTPFLILFIFVQKQLVLIIAAFFVGLFGQAVKVTTDALVQSKISDEYRGRTFAFYDVAVNGCIVLGALVAAVILPISGKSVGLPALIVAIYLVVTFILLRPKWFSARSLPTI